MLPHRRPSPAVNGLVHSRPDYCSLREPVPGRNTGAAAPGTDTLADREPAELIVGTASSAAPS